MRLLPLLILFSLASSAVPLEEAVKAYLDFNESTQSLALDASSQLIFINGKPSLVVYTDPEGNASILSDPNSIAFLIQNYSASANYSQASVLPTAGDIERFSLLIQIFNDSRQPQENECKRFIGIDQYPCTDYASCLKSCYTPLCRTLSYNVGPDFINAIAGYSNSLSQIDSAVNQTLQAIPLLENASPDQALTHLNTLSTRMQSIRSATTGVSSNPLFTPEGYYFCPLSKYDHSSLLQAQSSIEFSKNKLAILLVPDEISQLVSSETNARIGFRKSLEECASQARETQANSSAFVQATASIIRFAEVSALISSLNSLSNATSTECSLHEFALANDSYTQFGVACLLALQNASLLSARIDSLNARINSSRELISSKAGAGENVSELNASLDGIQQAFTIASSVPSLDEIDANLTQLENFLSARPSSSTPAGPSDTTPSSVPVYRPSKPQTDYIRLAVTLLAVVAAAAILFLIAKQAFQRRRRY